MKRIGFLAICILAGFGLVANGAMAAIPTYVVGKIYNSDYSATIAEAYVSVTCEGIMKDTTSGSDGSYSINFTDTACGVDSMAYVTATKASVGTGYGNGLVRDYILVNIGVGNVSIPEFGAVAGIATMLASSIGFMLIRKRSLAQTKKKPSA